MIIYRPHRGGLSESMELAKEFDTIQDMKEYIVKAHTDEEMGAAFEIDDIVIVYENAKDNRIGFSNTRYVCVKRYYSEDFIEKYGAAKCIGMCETDYEIGKYRAENLLYFDDIVDGKEMMLMDELDDWDE